MFKIPPRADSESVVPERLTVSSAEAAKLLGICPNSLWRLKTEGVIPHVRCGRKVLFSVEALKAFARGESAGDAQ